MTNDKVSVDELAEVISADLHVESSFLKDYIIKNDRNAVAKMMEEIYKFKEDYNINHLTEEQINLFTLKYKLPEIKLIQKEIKDVSELQELNKDIIKDGIEFNPMKTFCTFTGAVIILGVLFAVFNKLFNFGNLALPLAFLIMITAFIIYFQIRIRLKVRGVK